MSVATLIMLAGHKRLIVEQGDFLLHTAGFDDLSGSFRLEDMQKLTRELEIATSDMLDFYCRVLGEDKRMSLMAAMAKDSNLGAREAIKLGFATGYYKKATVDASATNERALLITAHYTELLKNKNTMPAADKDLITKLEDKMNSAFKGFAKFLGKITNQVSLKLASGEGVYVEPASTDAPDDLNGGRIFLVDEAGMPTTNAPADGEHTLEDGRVIVVSAGVITEVKEAVDASKLQEEVAALKAQLAEKESALTAMAATKDAEIEVVKAEAKKAVDTVQMAFNEFKTQVPGDKGKKDKDEADAKLDFSKMTTAQRVRAISKEKMKLESSTIQ